MKAITIVKHGIPEKAFEVQEKEIPKPKKGEVLIKVDAFGLNFADVMARNGLYREAPAPPFVPGYEVVGTIEEIGEGIQGFEKGQRVVAFTRFGGYAEYAITDYRALVAISDKFPNGVAAALATQYTTAYYAAYDCINMHKGEKVLVQAAAGGVGTAVVQLAKLKGCEVFGTAGSDEKLEYMRNNGVDHPINYRKKDFYEEIKKILGEERIDVAFDSVGGKTYSKSKKLLGAGGRIVNYGAAVRTGQSGGMFANIKLAWNMGLMHPLGFIMKSQSAIGVNMLRLGDYKPERMQRCMQNVIQLAEEGKLKPHVGATYKATEINDAHKLLEGRKSVGKIVVEW